MIVSPADMPALAALPDACCAQPRPVSLGAQRQLLPGQGPAGGRKRLPGRREGQRSP